MADSKVDSLIYFMADGVRWVTGGAGAAAYFEFAPGLGLQKAVLLGFGITLVLAGFFAWMSSLQARVGGNPFKG